MSSDCATRPETFFSNVTFYKQPDNGQIETESFIHSCQTLLPFFDHYGAAFKFVKYDLKCNLDSVRKVYESDKVKFKYINDMLEFDAKSKTRSCAEPLLWLKRGLHFIRLFIEKLASDVKNNEGQESLIPILDYCYKATVKKYHGVLVQKIVMLSWKAVPWRRDVIKVLCKGKPENQDYLVEDVESFLINMFLNLNEIDEIYERLNLDSQKKSNGLKN